MIATGDRIRACAENRIRLLVSHGRRDFRKSCHEHSPETAATFSVRQGDKFRTFYRSNQQERFFPDSKLAGKLARCMVRNLTRTVKTVFVGLEDVNEKLSQLVRSRRGLFGFFPETRIIREEVGVVVLDHGRA